MNDLGDELEEKEGVKSSCERDFGGRSMKYESQVQPFEKN